MHKKLLLPSQLNLSSFSSGCRASFESNCLLISLSSDSLYSLIFKIAIALTPPTAKKNTARKYWSERNAISPNSSSYGKIAPRALPSKHTRHEPLFFVLFFFMRRRPFAKQTHSSLATAKYFSWSTYFHLWVTAVIMLLILIIDPHVVRRLLM